MWRRRRAGALPRQPTSFFISQTAVTQQIRLLEEMLGCPLFDRSTRPVSLTPAGKAFLTEAKAILERMDQAIDRAHGASTGLSGSLRIGYLKGYEQSGFTDFLREFHQRHANLLITFYRCTTDQLAAGLLGNQFDLILTWDSTNLKQDERVDWLLAEEVGLVAALYAGGIDQNIQAAQQSDGLVKGLLPGPVVGQVHGDAFAPIALCFELGGHLDHLFAGTKNDYSGAGLHQALRHAVAQSSSAAGDNSLFPGEIK